MICDNPVFWEKKKIKILSAKNYSQSAKLYNIYDKQIVNTPS